MNVKRREDGSVEEVNIRVAPPSSARAASGPSNGAATSLAQDNDKSVLPASDDSPLHLSTSRDPSASKLSPLSQPFIPSPRKLETTHEAVVDGSSFVQPPPTWSTLALQTTPTQGDPPKKSDAAVAQHKVKPGHSAYVAPHLRGKVGAETQQTVKEEFSTLPASFKVAGGDRPVDRTDAPSAPPIHTSPTVNAKVVTNDEVTNSWLDSLEGVVNTSSARPTSESPPSDPNKIIDVPSDQLIDIDTETPAGPSALHTCRSAQSVTSSTGARKVALSNEYLNDLLRRIKAGEDIKGEFIQLNSLLEQKLRDFGKMPKIPLNLTDETQEPTSTAGPSFRNEETMTGDELSVPHFQPTSSGIAFNNQEPTSMARLSLTIEQTMSQDEPSTPNIQPTVLETGSDDEENDPCLRPSAYIKTSPPDSHRSIVVNPPPQKTATEPSTTEQDPPTATRTRLGYTVRAPLAGRNPLLRPRQGSALINHQPNKPPSLTNNSPQMPDPTPPGSHILGLTLDLPTKFLIMNDTPYSRGEDKELELDWRPVVSEDSKVVYVLGREDLE